MRILVIEDDENIASLIKNVLIRQSYCVDVAHDGDVGLELAWSYDYDLIILDIMMPKTNGMDVCHILRRDGLVVPIMMLTALSSEDDVIAGLDIGADDYLSKPFSLAELLARVRSLIRRSSEHKTIEIQIADMVVNVAHRTVMRDGSLLNLTSKEFTLLEYFAMNKGKVLTREAISEHVWDVNFDPRSNVIESLMKCLRQKVDRNHAVQLIHTVRGFGYKLDYQHAT